MLLNLWFRVRDIFILIFFKDPIKDYFSIALEAQSKDFLERIIDEKREKELLRLELKNREDEIKRLNEKIFQILSPRKEIEVELPEPKEIPFVRTDRTWSAERTRLEDLHSRARNEELLKRIAEREAEVAEVVNLEEALDSLATKG